MRSGELKALEWGDVNEKNGTWRNVDISSQLQEIISELKNARLNSNYVLPQHPEWKHGDAGKVLKDVSWTYRH
jgi:integrase